MPMTRRAISEIDIDNIFDAKCIRDLAKLAKISKEGDIQKLGNQLRENARIYIKAAREPSDNTLHDEIKALHEASYKNSYEQTAFLIDNLTSRARSLLIGRWEHANPGVAFPRGIDLKQIDHPDAVCASISSLCRTGGKIIETRMRQTGRPSKALKFSYYAPEKTRHFPKTVAEDQLIMHIAITWCDVTGKMPPKVVNPQGPGPFARLVRECLQLLGSNASAAKLINKYGQRRPD
jgi:hypothetical protein